MQELLIQIVKGLIIGLLYFEITKTNETTFQNLLMYTFFYVVMIYGAKLSGLDPMVVTNAFMTKTIFTLVDERVKRKEEKQS